MFPLLLDLMDMNSPLFRPCSSIYFFVKNDAFVNTTSLRRWLNKIGITALHKPLYAGKSSKSEHNSICSQPLKTSDGFQYGINCSNKMKENSESYVNDKTNQYLPFANWNSGILLNNRAMKLIKSEIILEDATQYSIQRLKEAKT